MGALEEIRERVEDIPAKGESAFMGLALPIQQITELWKLRHVAREDVARLLAAVEGVLGLHYEGEDTEEVLAFACIDGPCDHGDEECPEVTIKPCMQCSNPGAYYVEYPCPTVKAITSALEAGR